MKASANRDYEKDEAALDSLSSSESEQVLKPSHSVYSNSSNYIFSKFARTRTATLLSALSLSNYQSSLHHIYAKYFEGEHQQSLIGKVLRDHSMSELRTQKRCPFRADFVHELDDNSSRSSRASSRSKHKDKHKHKEKNKPKLLNAERSQSMVVWLIIERGLTLDVCHAPDRDTEIDAQAAIRHRAQNQWMGDSFTHFLTLYFEQVYTDSATASFGKKAENHDQQVVEHFIEYLRVLHQDHLAGHYEDGKAANDVDGDLSFSDEHKKSDDESSESDQAPITMDEYRMYVRLFFVCD